MVNEEARHSDVIDPLAAYSGISLFPSAFGTLPVPSKPHDFGTDLDGIHKHLKSMVSRNPSKLIEQARSILNSNSNLMQSKAATLLVKNEKKEEAAANVEENPQERRPALNRKRARFSLKPDARQPPVNLEPTFDIKQLKDPEEFFLAYERLENAKKEIQKQTGAILKDLNQQNPSTNTRQRRPGILGRSVRYKHQYSSITSEDDQNVEPSQVTFESGSISPSILGTEKDASPPIICSEMKTNEEVPLEEEEEEAFVASITNAENKVNKILDELLSANCEDLEGDRAINKLQECLQIKPINLEKLCLPDLEAIQTMNLRSSRGNLPERSLISVDSQLQRIENLKSKQDDENSVNPISTPFSMRSPLASLSALTRRISLSNSPGDPFSAHDLDQSSARNPSLFELSNHLSDAVGIAEKLGVSRLMSLLTKDDGTVAKGIKSPKILLGDVDSISKISSSNVLNVPQAGAEAALSETHANMEAKDISGSSTEVEVNEKLSFLEAQADAVAATNVLDDEMEDHEGSTSEQPNTSKVDAIKEYPLGVQTQLDQSTATCTENIVDGPSRSSGTDNHDKVKQKSRAGNQREGKRVSGRKSLAGAGTTWQGGVRRSTRFKTRPLEYWKGERLLYGRVHESLATVIGLKYVSPAKGNGQPTLKVKSLVSSEYNELVELAALH
ncbi:centromere protein C-like isoform X1 [Cucurbita pepo subsp. pepo]|uniref:centromere protein C-like isoform X1 n=1 Tax=Cucurbita pepo subsp. pepo TaxID=3664 RepID=UPI000C9D7656|nr:centromere protein C-like isoform X1 [Cucurbita pepo subsp. pepo]